MIAKPLETVTLKSFNKEFQPTLPNTPMAIKGRQTFLSTVTMVRVENTHFSLHKKRASQQVTTPLVKNQCGIQNKG